MNLFKSILLFSLIFISYSNVVKAQTDFKFEIKTEEKFVKDEVVKSTKKIGDFFYILSSVTIDKMVRVEETYYFKKYTNEMEFIKQVELPKNNIDISSFSEKNNQIEFFFKMKKNKKEEKRTYYSFFIDPISLKVGSSKELKNIKRFKQGVEIDILRKVFVDSSGKTSKYYLVLNGEYKFSKLKKIVLD